MSRTVEIHVRDDGKTGPELSRRHKDKVCWIADTAENVLISFEQGRSPLKGGEDHLEIPAGKSKTYQLENGVSLDSYKYTVKVGNIVNDPTIIVDD